MSAQATKSGPRPLAALNGKCTRDGCGGQLAPDVDRHGGNIDSCQKCGTVYRTRSPGGGPPRTPGTSAPGLSTANGGPRPCSVAGCPGKIVGHLLCPSCAKRDAFVEAKLPRRRCAICEGEIRGRRRKYCKPCGKVVAKVQTETLRLARANGAAPASAPKKRGSGK